MHAEPMPAHDRPHGLGALDGVADYWGLVLAYGLLTLGLGVALAVWPGETLKVCAVLIAIQLLVGGVLRLLTAVGARGLDAGVRVLIGLSGALALIVGLLCLRDPLQTLVALGIVLGAWWVVSGVIDVLGAIWSPTPGRRAGELLGGAVTLLAGGFLLINTELSLGVLVVVLCVWLIAMGVIAIGTALRLRSAHRSHHDAPSGTPAPAV